MSKKMICENRSIDCGDWCVHADTHVHSLNCASPGEYCTAKHCVEECDDEYRGKLESPKKPFSTMEKETQYGKNSAYPSPSECFPKSLNIPMADSFRIDSDKLFDSLCDRAQENVILSTLKKQVYEKEEMECLRVTILAYSTLIDRIRKALGNVESNDILSTIESLKNCENCDVSIEEQCYPDGRCETRECKKINGTWSGWRNPEAHPDDVTILVMSKDDIEQLIEEELE